MSGPTMGEAMARARRECLLRARFWWADGVALPDIAHRLTMGPASIWWRILTPAERRAVLTVSRWLG